MVFSTTRPYAFIVAGNILISVIVPSMYPSGLFTFTLKSPLKTISRVNESVTYMDACGSNDLFLNAGILSDDISPP